MNLNATLNSKDEDINELKIVVGRKVEKIKTLQGILNAIQFNNDALVEAQKNLKYLLSLESVKNEEIRKELQMVRDMHDEQAKKLTELKVEIAELKTENKYFIERFDFTDQEKKKLLKKLDHNESEVKLLTDEIHKLKRKNTETSINLSTKTNTFIQQEQGIETKHKLLKEQAKEIKEWRQKFHETEKLMIRWKIRFIYAVLMLATVTVILYDYIQSKTEIIMWNAYKTARAQLTSITGQIVSWFSG